MLLTIDAKERLSRTAFNPGQAFMDHGFQFGIYTCPHCSEAVRITTRDLQDAMGSSSSNLSEVDASQFSKKRPLDSAKWESFLDFYCPGCSSPVRIVYEPWEFAMGSYGFTVTLVVEADAS